MKVYPYVISGLLFLFAGALFVLNVALLAIYPEKSFLTLVIPTLLLLISMENGCNGMSVCQVEAKQEYAAKKFNMQAIAGQIAVFMELGILVMRILARM